MPQLLVQNLSKTEHSTEETILWRGQNNGDHTELGNLVFQNRTKDVEKLEDSRKGIGETTFYGVNHSLETSNGEIILNDVISFSHQ